MKSINIDMDYLLFAYQDDCADNIYYLDSDLGDIRLVHHQLDDIRSLTDEIELSVDRFLYIPKLGKGKFIEILKNFMDQVKDDQLKKILDVATDSPHILEAFKKILSKSPEYLKQMDDFIYEQSLKEVLEWLKANSIDPVRIMPKPR